MAKSHPELVPPCWHIKFQTRGETDQGPEQLSCRQRPGGASDPSTCSAVASLIRGASQRSWVACATRSSHTAPSQQKGGRGCRVSACLNCTVGISLLRTSRCFHPHLCVLLPLGCSIPSCLSLLGLPGPKPKLVLFPSQRWWSPEPGTQVAWVLLGSLFAHMHGHLLWATGACPAVLSSAVAGERPGPARNISLPGFQKCL